MKRNPGATAQTKKNLVEAFWTLYCDKKMEHISVKEITAKAGYNRSTFYEYFTDITDLLNKIEDSLFSKLKEGFSEAFPLDTNYDFVRKLAEVYDSEGKYFSVLLGINGDPAFAKKLKDVMRPFLLKAFDISTKDIRTKYLYEFGASAIIATIAQWYQSKKDIPAEDFFPLLRSMLGDGVLKEILKLRRKGK